MLWKQQVFMLIRKVRTVLCGGDAHKLINKQTEQKHNNVA